MKLKLLVLLIAQTFILFADQDNWKPGCFTILNSTEKKPTRTAVLIMCPPNERSSFKEYRWQLGKKTWEQYMNSHPNVDCYFLVNTNLRKDTTEQTWIEGNTIYVGDWYLENHGITRQLNRTIKAIEKLLPNYTHFIRTNVNAFWDLKQIDEYAQNHHQSMFTGPLWQGSWYVIGYGIFFSKDVAEHIVSEYKRLEGKKIVSYELAEDAIITSLATGIFPYYHLVGRDGKFTCCPSLPFGVRQLMCLESFSADRLSKYGLLLFPAPSFEQTFDYCQLALHKALLYRIRTGYDLDKLAKIYEFLLHNIYPELPKIDLVEYVNSLNAPPNDDT